jgi:two-component system NarL family sensor kinase
MSTDHDLSILNTLAHSLSHSASLEQVLLTALDRVAELLNLETGWVWLLDEQTGEPLLAATRNLPPGLVVHPELMEGTCYCLSTYQAGDLRGAANVNVVWCSRLTKLVEGSNQLRCHASIPLYADDDKLGILNVASPDWRELSAGELNLLYTVGALVSLAVARMRLAARTARLAAVEERNRLARDIHDTLAQSLAAITMQLESADALAEAGNDGRVGEAVRRALGLARSTLEEARRSVVELRATPVTGRGLVRAIRALPAELSVGVGRCPELRVRTRGMGERLPTALEVGLYHIAREALANVCRHADAVHASVFIERRGERVRMRIVDDGVGFDVAGRLAGRFGILGMNERARLLGGRLRIASAPGHGTTAEVDVPIRGGGAAAGEGGG